MSNSGDYTKFTFYQGMSVSIGCREAEMMPAPSQGAFQASRREWFVLAVELVRFLLDGRGDGAGIGGVGRAVDPVLLRFSPVGSLSLRLEGRRVTPANRYAWGERGAIRAIEPRS